MQQENKSRHRFPKNFFEKEPKFSVLIALSAIVLLLFLYLFAGLSKPFAAVGQEQYAHSLLSQPVAEDDKPACSIKRTLIIWKQTQHMVLPVNSAGSLKSICLQFERLHAADNQERLLPAYTSYNCVPVSRRVVSCVVSS